jgi:DNA invertase Pin-like site-specific DNA recombinase
MVAYSYLRFSSPQQASGDSIRRQVEKTEDWCRRNKVQLDQSMSLRDEGVSAYKGKHRENPDTHALATFVNAVRSGRVQPGSYLVVESLDRLSREKIRPALTLLLNLIEAGVKVVQLMPVEMIFDEDVEPMQLMMAVMELNRGHSESAVKSERVGAAWAKKRADAGAKKVTRKLPGWVKAVGGEGREMKSTQPGEVRFVLDPTGIGTVRRIFDMALAGNGVHAIALALNADEVPVMGRKEFKGRAVRWNETVVYHVLRSRAAYGEFQPSKGRGSDRHPVGEPIADYYPAVIDRDTFLRAQAALKSRTKKGSGRRGKHINLLAGLLRDARDGGSLTYKNLKNRPSTIIPVGAKQGTGAVWSSFPATILERGIRSKLAEVKTADIAGNNPATKRVDALSARKAELVELTAAWEAKMDDVKIVDLVAANLSRYKGELESVNAELAEAQREAANPFGEAWGEARTLAGMNPDEDTDELRTRIKAALRRCIESITCLFCGSKANRIAAVRVQFRSGSHREYLLIANQATSTRSARWKILSFAARANLFDDATGTTLPTGFDLREPEQAARAECVLSKYDGDILKLADAADTPRDVSIWLSCLEWTD